MDQERLKKFNAWRKRSAKGLPALANRVFALRGKLYSGAGFHWALERKLGSAMVILNDYDASPQISDVLVAGIVLEELYRDVAAAEASTTTLVA